MSKISVAIQGIEGSFHHQASGLILPGHDIEVVETPTFADVFDAVDTDINTLGLVAYRNNVAGRIGEVYRLIRERDISLLRAMDLGIEQFLVSGVPGVSLEEVQAQERVTVYSHEMALKQVAGWLDKFLPQAVRVESKDTAGAIRDVVASGDVGHLAVGGAFASELHGGTIVPTGKRDKKTGKRKLRGIQDDKENTTRFMLVARPDSPLIALLYEEQPPTHGVLLFTAQDGPGALRRAIKPFDDRGCDMVEIASRATPRRHGRTKFQFFVDYERPKDSREHREMLKMLKKRTRHVRYVGSYAEMPPQSSREF